MQVQQSCDYFHRLILEHVQSRDGAQDQVRSTMSPDPFEFLACVMGSGTETMVIRVLLFSFQGLSICMFDSNFRPYLFFRHAWHTFDI